MLMPTINYATSWIPALEGGTDKFSRNIGKEFYHYAQYSSVLKLHY